MASRSFCVGSTPAAVVLSAFSNIMNRTSDLLSSYWSNDGRPDRQVSSILLKDLFRGKRRGPPWLNRPEIERRPSPLDAHDQWMQNGGILEEPWQR